MSQTIDTTPADILAIRDRVRALPPRPDRVRTIGAWHYAVPDTGHWADWQDDDAVQHHGIRCGGPKTAAALAGIYAVVGHRQSASALYGDLHGDPVPYDVVRDAAARLPADA
jgi:hypothetical protein